MSLTAAIIDAMVQSGCTADQLAAAMKADLAERNAGRKAKCAADAERQRRSRENRKCHTMSRNVTVTECDPPNDIYSNPPEITPEDDKSSSTPRPKRLRKSVGDSLPDDWQPILTETAQRIADGWPPGWITGQVAAFRDHATDKGRKSKDWQAAFRTWIAKADAWGSQKNAKPCQNQQPEYTNAFARVVAAKQAERVGIVG